MDLDIDVNNGPGDDLAIYASAPPRWYPREEEAKGTSSKLSMTHVEEEISATSVLGLDSRGESGRRSALGSGQNPDKFDLGALDSTRRIRIMFRAYSQPLNQGDRPLGRRAGD